MTCYEKPTYEKPLLNCSKTIMHKTSPLVYAINILS